MKKNALYWFFVTAIFLDFVVGGLVFIFAGWYGGYMSIPIYLIEGAGFTYGITLLPLIPYAVLLRFLYKHYKTLAQSKKKLTQILLAIIAALYLFGVISMVNKSIQYEYKKSQGLLEQQVAEKQFENDVVIKDFLVADIDGWYKLYEVTFEIIIPSEYLGDAEGAVEIALDSKGDWNKYSYTLEYENQKIVEESQKSRRSDDEVVSSSFDENGDLVLSIVYIINEINEEVSPSSPVELILNVEPFNNEMHRVKYTKSLDTTY